MTVAKRRSAEEWMAEVDGIVHQYRGESGSRGLPPLTRKQAIERMVELGFSEGDAIRYLDRNRAKPAVPHR
jgi:hypothetical protein